MAEYAFDGRWLRKKSGQKVGEIDRKNIRDAHNKVVAVFDGKVVKDDLGKKLATIEEIRKIVEGDVGIEVVALWYFFIRK